MLIAGDIGGMKTDQDLMERIPLHVITKRAPFMGAAIDGL